MVFMIRTALTPILAEGAKSDNMLMRASTPPAHLLLAQRCRDGVAGAGAVHAHLPGAKGKAPVCPQLHHTWITTTGAFPHAGHLPSGHPIMLQQALPTWHFSCSAEMNRRLAWSRDPEPNLTEGALARVDSTVDPA